MYSFLSPFIKFSSRALFSKWLLFSNLNNLIYGNDNLRFTAICRTEWSIYNNIVVQELNQIGGREICDNAVGIL